MYFSDTIPSPGTAAVVEIAKHSVVVGVPSGHGAAKSLTGRVAWSGRTETCIVVDAKARDEEFRRTVTTKPAVVVLPLVSTAEHVTFVRPVLNRLPDLGLQDTGTAPSTSSLAVSV
jgi:hypothetical protein